MKLDINQIIIKKRLDNLLVKLNAKQRFFDRVKLAFIKKNLQLKNNLKSYYIYGGVGRGKTMLMKDFFENLSCSKTYFHFNKFMYLIHKNLHEIRKNKNCKDDLQQAISLIIKDSKVICFDEFQVNDIADAMLLARIFSFLFINNKIIIFTANIHPKDLYQNGLQRELFLDFVNNILIKNCEILHLDSEIDYRSRSGLNNISKRFFVANKKNRHAFNSLFSDLTSNAKGEIKKIKIWGRELVIKKSYNNIALFSFKSLLCKNFSASDYSKICQNYDLIFLDLNKKFNIDHKNEIKRFTLFIDEIYENKTSLIIISKSKISNLGSDINNIEFFERTKSRINEIKSDQYWENSKFFG